MVVFMIIARGSRLFRPESIVCSGTSCTDIVGLLKFEVLPSDERIPSMASTS